MVKGPPVARSMAPPSPPCKENQLRDPTTFARSIHRREISRRGNRPSMDRRTRLSLLALASLLVPAAGAGSLPSAERAGTEKFLVAVGMPDSVEFFVPARSHVSFTLSIEAGSATDLMVRGPGCHAEQAS